MAKKRLSENYLEKIPLRNESFGYSVDENGIVTLERENKGIFNRIFQVLLKKPKVSYIHLDEMGSFLWVRFSGDKDIVALGKEVEEHFGEKANPLYERLAQYIQILKSYGFITFKE